MNLQDALTISALGIGVVFAGLMLTALLIFVVGRLPALGARLKSLAKPPAAAPPTREPSPLPAVDPAVVAVVVAVLEVERRLHRAEHGGRLTIERTL